MFALNLFFGVTLQWLLLVLFVVWSTLSNHASNLSIVLFDVCGFGGVLQITTMPIVDSRGSNVMIVDVTHRRIVFFVRFSRFYSSSP